MISELWHKPWSLVDIRIWEFTWAANRASRCWTCDFLDHLHFSHWNNMQEAEHRPPRNSKHEWNRNKVSIFCSFLQASHSRRKWGKIMASTPSSWQKVHRVCCQMAFFLITLGFSFCLGLMMFLFVCFLLQNAQVI